MTAADIATPILFGLKLYELLTLIGIVAGPIAAVIITIVFERIRTKKESRTQVLRMLLTTRRLPSDPTYIMAINLIEVEFNDVKEVMTARRDYMSLVQKEVSDENLSLHNQNLAAKQAEMIHWMMKSVGLRSKVSELVSDAYVSTGFIGRDNLYLDSLKATIEMAQATKSSNAILAKIHDLPPMWGSAENAN